MIVGAENGMSYWMWARMLALALLLWVGSSGRILAESLPFRTYSSDDGLAQSVVLSMAQDGGGYLWFGTPDGLSRFDGREFTHFDQSEGLPGQVVRTILEDGEGVFWAGTDSGLARWHQGRWQAELTEFIEHPIRCLASDQRGTLWIGTWGGGVVRRDASGVKVFQSDAGLAHDKVRAILVDQQGQVWLGTYGGGVTRVKEGTMRSWGPGEGLADPFVRALAVDRQGQLLVGTNHGVFQKSGEVFRPFGPASPLADTGVTALLEDRHGRLWIGTRDRGVCLLTDAGLSCYGLKQGLAEQSINSLLEDREGNLWFATFGGGVSRLSNESFVNYTVQGGLPYGSVQAFAEHQDEIWIGTHGGGIARVDAFDQIRIVGGESGLPHEKVMAVWADADSAVWVGTLGGAARFQDGGFTTWSVDDGLAHEVVYDILRDREGTLWFATHEGLTRLSADGASRIFTTNEGLPANRVTQIIERREGGLWVGTEAGLAKLENDRVANDRHADGLAGDYIYALHEQGDGSLWVGTAGGLSVLRSGSLSTYTTADGLSHQKCTVVLEDDSGRLWIGTTRGINVFDGERFSVFSIRDGLPSGEVNPGAGFKDRQGRLWFGTVRGATVFQPDALPPTPPTPLVHITGFEIRGVPMAMELGRAAAASRLDYHQNDLHFEFVGISLAYPDVTYKYRLEGSGQSWRSTSAREVDFLALPPGRYAFVVQASHGHGVWSEEARFELEIAPPFWQTWWFRTASMLALAGLVFAGHRFQVRQIARQKKQLEVQVRERTAEVRRMVEELRDLNEKKDEFLGVAAHDLRSPLGGVLSTTELLMRLLDEDRMDKPLWRKFLGNVRTTAIQMHTLVEDLLDVAAIETGRVKLHLASEKMADMLEEREAFQLEAAHDKEIELVVDKAMADVCVTVDRIRIGEVLDNLLTNAIKYTEPGGCVRVYCQCEEAELVTHVEDTGLGFEPKELDKVFLGQKLSARPTAGEKSTGLGLVIVKKLVELHGGRIWLASEKNKGSTFSFSLPRAG